MAKEASLMQIFKPSFCTNLTIPYAFSCIYAGFPSPAEDCGYNQIDLNAYLIKHPASTFFVRVAGDSMIEKGIFPGDILVVDKSLEVKNGSIIVANLNKEFTLKEFRQDADKKIHLIPANKNYKNIEIKMEDEFEVWGVVTNTIHNFL